MQLKNTLGTSWKKSIEEEKANLITLSIYDQSLSNKKQSNFFL